MTSVIAGVLLLAVLETLVASPTATKNAGRLTTVAVGAVRWLIDPAVPGIPDLRKATPAPKPSPTHPAAPSKPPAKTPPQITGPGKVSPGRSGLP